MEEKILFLNRNLSDKVFSFLNKYSTEVISKYPDIYLLGEPQSSRAARFERAQSAWDLKSEGLYNTFDPQEASKFYSNEQKIDKKGYLVEIRKLKFETSEFLSEKVEKRAMGGIIV